MRVLNTGIVYLASGMVWAALVAACASSSGIPRPPEPTTPAVLARDEAIDAALQRASGLIGEDEIQQTTAFYTTYDGAYEALGFETPLPGSARPSGENPTWVVTFKGMFYEPQGPPPGPSETRGPREPTCSEVIVLIPDSVEPGDPDAWSELTFRAADSCS